MKTPVYIILLVMLFTTTYSQRYISQAKPFGAKEWGYINEKGEFVIPAKFRKCFEFSPDGYAVVLDEPTKQYYFININGDKLTTEITSFKLIEFFGFGVKGFTDGLVPVRQGDRWGFLDTDGKLVIQVKYDKVTEFSGGFAMAQAGARKVVLNKKGDETEISDKRVEGIKEFSEGLSPFNTGDKKSGFVDTNGSIAIEPTYQSVGYFANGLAWAKTPAGKIGYINKKGDWVIEPKFEAAKEFDAISGMARVKSGSLWGYVSRSGEMLNITLDSYGDFSEGLCSGKKGAQWGFFDSSGKWVIDPQFEGVREFKNGFAAAKKGDKWGFIDRNGQWAIQPTFETVKDMEKIK